MVDADFSPRFPDITVQLSGEDGNAFVIMGAVTRALRHAGKSDDEIADFRRDATAGNYDHLLQTCMKWVNVT